MNLSRGVIWVATRINSFRRVSGMILMYASVRDCIITTTTIMIMIMITIIDCLSSYILLIYVYVNCNV